MDKAIGFSLVYDREPPRPSWLGTYPWLADLVVERNGWTVRLWGHGDLASFVDGNRIVVGYSDADMEQLELLQNRSVVIELGENAVIANDFAGYLPVFYGGGMASTDEDCLEIERTLYPSGLVSFLISNSLLAGLTLWEESKWLFGNSILTLTKDGQELIKLLEPLQFSQSDPRIMPDVLEKTIRRYTDPLDEVYLTLSSGYDSRLIMLNAEWPGRIHARTYPISRPVERSNEYAIARCSAEMAGVGSHEAVSAWDYGPYLQQIFEFYGPTMTAVNAYVMAFIIRTYEDNERWPMIHGMAGNPSSGTFERGYIKYVARRMADEGRFEQINRTDPHAWNREELDQLFTIDWREAYDGLQPRWARMWRETEGYTVPHKACLLRLRHRAPLMTVRTFALADAYGGAVAPYCDKEYTEYMLSLPHEARLDRVAQREMAKKKWPNHFRLPAPLSQKDWDTANTIDADNISEEAMWPIDKLDHPMFNRAYVDKLKQKALDGDVRSFHLLWPLQTIAYGLMNEYLGRH